MPTFESKQVKNYRPPIVSAMAGEVKAVRGSVALPDTLAASDIVKLVVLPAEHVVVDCILDSDDLDTGGTPTIIVSAGVLNSGATDIESGQKLIDGSGVAKTGGIARMDQQGAPRIAPSSTTDRIVGVKVDTVAATKAAGTIGLTLLYRVENFGA